MAYPVPRMKRVFDLASSIVMAACLLPVLIVMMFAVLVTEGRPVFYTSLRRAGRGAPVPIVKFRTMRRDADKIANRDTVPVSRTRFLNLPPNSPLYTPIGRFIERTMLTEMPQLLHIFQGRLSMIGNRPLPSNVVASLREQFPHVEDRFLMPCGLTGPVQLIGRDSLSDADRLEIEIAYCEAVARSYSAMLDLRILVYTVLGGLLPRFRMTQAGVLSMLREHDNLHAADRSPSMIWRPIVRLQAMGGFSRRTEPQ